MNEIDSRIASRRPIGDDFGMKTVTLDLDDAVARHVEESARREHKSLSQWVTERVTPEACRPVALAAMEALAVANGYPPNWLTLFGSLADDNTFAGPPRGATRPVELLKRE